MTTQKTITKEEESELFAFKEGSVAGFDLLYQRYHQAVYQNIHKLVKYPEYAEEILQDVFVALWQNRAKIKEDQPLGNWLFVVSFNKSMTFLNRQLKDSLKFVDDYLPYEGLSAYEDQDEDMHDTQMGILKEALAYLSPRKREIFTLCKFEGYSKEVVADMLGISARSVADYLKQANQGIRQYIANNPSAVNGTNLTLLCFYLHYLSNG